MLSAIAVIVLLSGALGGILLLAEAYCKPNARTLADRIEAILPRIQCAQCGFPGCRPYAEALAAGVAATNLCPPGGKQTALELAELLGLDAGDASPVEGTASIAQVAKIDEAVCIGCNLCQRACPVDAIVGVPQMMHTVIAEHCTGCELCLAPCPVDCIDIVPRSV